MDAREDGRDEPPSSGCGAVTFIQRFSGNRGFFLHWHSLVLSGACQPDGSDGSLRFVPLPEPTTRDANSERMELIDKWLSLGLDLVGVPSRELDAHYEMRHRIAHDQCLLAPDDPAQSAKTTLSQRVSVSVDEWKTMIKDFLQTIADLDRTIRAAVVRDGVSLAVRTVLERSDACGVRPTVGRMKHEVETEWRVVVTLSDITTALGHLGRATTNERAIQRRTVT